jgi:putative transcriptional regulator
MNRRPSQETLAAFAAGTLDEGLSLVVAAHVAVNPRSAAEYRDLAAIGGAMLEDIEPVEMESSARDEVLTRIDATPAPLAPTAVAPPEPGLPAVLAPYRLGRWMPIAAGDFDEADEEHAHTPHVDPKLGCTCIVALTGKVVFEGWLGRMLQPLVRL